MADEKVTEEIQKISEDKPSKDAKADKADKSGKSDKKKGPGLGKRMVKFFRDTKGEFKKIIWPTFPAVVRNTGVTLAMCIILGVLIALVDSGLGALVDLMLKL